MEQGRVGEVEELDAIEPVGPVMENIPARFLGGGDIHHGDRGEAR